MIAEPAVPGASNLWRPSRRMQVVVFNRKQPKIEESRADAQSALVEMLLGADELERRKLLLMALQSGELKKSEAAELLRLVERLEQITGRR